MIKKPEADDKAWHLDKRVPIALIVTILLTFGGQAVTFTIWLTRVDSRIVTLEEKGGERDKRDEKTDEKSAEQDTKLNEKLGDIAVSIATLTAKAEATNEKITATNTQINDVRGKVEALTQQVLQDKTTP